MRKMSETQHPDRTPVVSIVVPAHNEEANLAPLVREIEAALPDADDREILIVDDGSTDGTWAVICSLREGDARIKGVRLSRNFGHQYALLA